MSSFPPPRVSIVVPVFNEESTIRDVLDHLLAVPLDKEIIVVDDGSTDATPNTVAAFGDAVVYCRLVPNQGKGAALRHGFAKARGSVVVVQDADLELSPSLMVELVEPIIQGRADVVYGSRFLLGGDGVRWSRRMANRMLTGLANRLYGTQLTDMETAHKALRADLVPRLGLVSERFEIEVELTAKLAALGARFVEIASPYRPRTKDEGKKIRFTDGVTAVQALWRHRRWHP